MKAFTARLFLVALMALSLKAVSISEIAGIVGVRDNQLIGYGLVVGLNGTGDGSSSEFTIQSLSNMLATMDVKVSADDIKSKNVAAVIVTAKLPAFARQGDKIDVSVASIGDAKSLAGGTLLMTPLKGVDGEIYSIAQGSVSVGGRSGGRGDNNHPTAARLPGGALVERELAFDFYSQDSMVLSLNEVSFETASQIQRSINEQIGYDIARAIDPKTVLVKKPADLDMIELAARVLALDVKHEAAPKIVIDERTGTIVSGVNILVSPAVITHKDISIKISQESPNEADFSVDEASVSLKNSSITTPKTPDIASLTRALSKLGATPADIIAIIQNLKRVGAINVPVEVI